MSYRAEVSDSRGTLDSVEGDTFEAVLPDLRRMLAERQKNRWLHVLVYNDDRHDCCSELGYDSGLTEDEADEVASLLEEYGR